MKLTANQVSTLFIGASFKISAYPQLRFGQAFWDVLLENNKDVAEWAMKNTEHHKLYESNDKDFVTNFVMANLVEYQNVES